MNGIVEQIGTPLDLYDKPDNSSWRFHRFAGDEFPQGKVTATALPASRGRTA